MRLARVLILLGLLVSIALLLSHFLGLPVHSVRGWLFSPRVQKEVFFSISDVPFNQESWTSRWGDNRPEDHRPHAILSEIEVRVKHESRSSLVEVSITGDSEEEVDAFIRTINADVERTYSSNDPLAPDHGDSRGGLDDSIRTIYWRQRYLWLLIANAFVFFVLWLSLRRRKSQDAEQVE